MDPLRQQQQGQVTSQRLIQRDQEEQQHGLVLATLMMGIQGIYGFLLLLFDTQFISCGYCNIKVGFYHGL